MAANAARQEATGLSEPGLHLAQPKQKAPAPASPLDVVSMHVHRASSSSLTDAGDCTRNEGRNPSPAMGRALARGEAIGDGRAGPSHGEPRAEEEARRRGRRRRARRPAALAAGVPGRRPAMRRLLYVPFVAFLPRCSSHQAPACHHGRNRPFFRAERPPGTHAFCGGVLLFGRAFSRLATATQRRRVRVPDRPGGPRGERGWTVFHLPSGLE